MVQPVAAGVTRRLHAEELSHLDQNLACHGERAGAWLAGGRSSKPWGEFAPDSPLEGGVYCELVSEVGLQRLPNKARFQGVYG